MTEALAYLLATFATCANPSLSATAQRTATLPVTSAGARAAWDSETQTWSAPPRSGPSAGLATSLGGPELPFEKPVEFALPNGGRGWYLGKSGMERVRVVRGADGRFHQVCEPAQGAAEAPAADPTDR
jgi:hypothetical protein